MAVRTGKKRYEIHVQVHRLRDPVSVYVIDWQTRLTYAPGRWPPGVVELMYLNMEAFRAQAVIVEDVDPEKGPMGIFGEWYYFLPPMSAFMLKHPRWRWWCTRKPYIKLKLTEVGGILSKEEEEEDRKNDLTAACSAPSGN